MFDEHLPISICYYPAYITIITTVTVATSPIGSIAALHLPFTDGLPVRSVHLHLLVLRSQPCPLSQGRRLESSWLGAHLTRIVSGSESLLLACIAVWLSRLRHQIRQ